MDRATARKLSKEMEAALQPVAKKYGLAIVGVGGTVGTTEFLAKFECCEVSSDGVAQTKERSDFTDQATFFGLQASDLDRTFVSQGNEFRIVGLKPGRSKYPIIGERLADGKRYKFPGEKVAALIALEDNKAAKRRSRKEANNE